MDFETYLKFAGALIFVLALIVGGSWLMRRAGLAATQGSGRRRRRLAVIETLSVDGKRRLVLVRRDEREHLLLVGGGADITVECGIVPPPAEAQP